MKSVLLSIICTAALSISYLLHAAADVSAGKSKSATCAACHGPTGAGIPGAFPAMTGSPVVTGAVDAHIDIVFNGKAGTAMAAYKGQLSDVDIAAVITYERNALGNSVGDLVQPSAIKNLR